MRNGDAADGEKAAAVVVVPSGLGPTAHLSQYSTDLQLAFGSLQLPVCVYSTVLSLMSLDVYPFIIPCRSSADGQPHTGLCQRGQQERALFFAPSLGLFFLRFVCGSWCMEIYVCVLI